MQRATRHLHALSRLLSEGHACHNRLLIHLDAAGAAGWSSGGAAAAAAGVSTHARWAPATASRSALQQLHTIPQVRQHPPTVHAPLHVCQLVSLRGFTTSSSAAQLQRTLGDRQQQQQQQQLAPNVITSPLGGSSGGAAAAATAARGRGAAAAGLGDDVAVAAAASPAWRLPRPGGPGTLLPPQLTFSVRAHQVGTRINLAQLRRQAEFAGMHVRELGRDTLVVVLDSGAALVEPIDAMAPHGLPPHPYLVALNYGSVVLYNVRPDHHGSDDDDVMYGDLGWDDVIDDLPSAAMLSGARDFSSTSEIEAAASGDSSGSGRGINGSAHGLTQQQQPSNSVGSSSSSKGGGDGPIASSGTAAAAAALAAAADLEARVLGACRRCASSSTVGIASPGAGRHEVPQVEDFRLVVSPDSPSLCEVTADAITLQQLDLQTLGLISRVLGQSVAMDQANSYVNQMLGVFYEINELAKDTGRFDHKYSAASLLRFVAQNNIIYADVLNTLRVLDKHPTAWKVHELDRLWTQLRNELEIETRYETLTIKLDLVQDSLKFFLELAHNRKSDWLELTIVVLIAGEIMLGLYEIWARSTGAAS